MVSGMLDWRSKYSAITIHTCTDPYICSLPTREVWIRSATSGTSDVSIVQTTISSPKNSVIAIQSSARVYCSQMSGTTISSSLPSSSSSPAGAQPTSVELPTNTDPSAPVQTQIWAALLAGPVGCLHSRHLQRLQPKKGTITAKTVFAVTGTAVGTFLAGLALWPSFVGVDAAQKANLLAQWTARKEFYEFCESVCGFETCSARRYGGAHHG